ncbi:1-(5-phosphoribosyl)-5-[(5-phosphoribosylamino)methylideneamino]imidazole-4-carboxamide isomerase [bacterium]|nr:MAG: 1-(5-phosphoribosyl)-5-[(5-phosphoribosylamino)methylideneamino]imidazole-4-carboxamide isomerase [bacterium]
MIIIPAIDLKDGKAVRYRKGKYEKKVYSSNPVEAALEWQRQGAQFLHLVDLDGAFTGKQKNLKLIEKITRSLKIPVEVSGGVRALDVAEKIFNFGAKRVILGTRAIEDIGFLKACIKKFGAKVALSLDASGSMLGLYGWKKQTAINLGAFIKKLEALRLKTIVYTDRQRDGTLQGLNITAIKKMLKSTSIDMIVSGGVASLDDIKKLSRLKLPNLRGVIVGKALYEKRFSLKDALDILSIKPPTKHE